MVNQSGTPLKLRVPGAVGAPEGVTPCTVSALTARVKTTLENDFASVWVVGEVSSLSRPMSGHLYFNLKDSGAVLRSVMWRATALRHRYAVEDGMEVIVRGRLTVYPPRGDYQFIIEELYQKGAGAQDLALRQLKERLQKLGYFAPERKRQLPRFPRRIALVASPTGAAVRDMLEVLGRRWPGAEIWVRGVRVQGDGAAEDIAAALGHLSGVRGLDVVILGRGGGSSEDLAAFNAEAVAHAIFSSRVPVISAIGHEVDVTLADLVADRRALTPSEAAEIATPDRQELLEHLRSRAQRLHGFLLARYRTSRHTLQGLAQRRVFQLPLERLRELECRLDNWDERLRRGMERRLQQAGHAVETRAAQLESLSPLNVLARGYSLTRFPQTRGLVRSAAQVRPGDAVEIVVRDGTITARVTDAGRDSAPPASHE